MPLIERRFSLSEATGSSPFRLTLAWLLLAGTAISPVPAKAQTVPEGADVRQGAVDIARPAPGQMTIKQGSERAVVNWDSFSIGTGGTVTVAQPSRDAALLNRVRGPLPSRIDGRLKANGKVYIINPAGLIVGKGGQVDASAFVASTLDTTDEDFMAGRDRFRGDGTSALLRNEGTIRIVPGGYVALLGGRVSNTGTIEVPLGKVGLGAGEEITLDVGGDGFLQVTLPSDTNGSEPLVENTGRISADGGHIEMKAATARNAVRNAINLSGLAEARTVSGRSGHVVLGGGAGGRVAVSGTVRTGSPLVTLAESPPSRPGGRIEITGHEIDLQGATLRADAPTTGGEIRVGGDMRGSGPLLQARTVTIDAASHLSADATGEGNGGNVVIWSTGRTVFLGAVSATGGPKGGDGGFVEVSGKSNLSFSGTSDTSAPKGRTGTLLLDPTNIRIIDGLILIAQPADPIPASATLSSSILFTQEIELALGSNNVEINTASADEEDGDITLEDPLAWSTGNRLTMVADRDIVLQADTRAVEGALTLDAGGDVVVDSAETFVITSDAEVTADRLLVPGNNRLTFATSGDVVLDAEISAPTGTIAFDVGGSIRPTAKTSVTAGAFEITNGTWSQIAQNLPSFDATDFRLSGEASFRRFTGGDGAANPYEIADIYGLQGLGSPDLLSANAQLVSDIEASGTTAWNDGDGFRPIAVYSGDFDGGGFDVASLSVQRANEEEVGLFGWITDGSAANFSLTEVDIVGRYVAGGVTGQNSRGIIENVSVTGSVSGQFAGGIVGENFQGEIRKAHFDGDVRATYNSFPTAFLNGPVAGGIVANNTSLVEDSVAQGTVTAAASDGATVIAVGGIAGFNTNTGNITGNIQRVRSESDVVVEDFTQSNDEFARLYAGGAVGRTLNSVSDAVSHGSITDNVTAPFVTKNVAGLVGLNSGGAVSRGLATGPISSDADNIAGNVVSADGEVSSVFWDVESSGIPGGTDSATGLTTAELQDTEGFQATAAQAGWDFEATWAPGDDGNYPTLYSVSPVIFAQPGNLTATYGDPQTVVGVEEVRGGPGIYVFGPTNDALERPIETGFDGNLNRDVGSYAMPVLTETPVTSNGGQEYRIVSTEGTLTVTPAPAIGVNVGSEVKTYGDTVVLGASPVISGLVNSDTLSELTLSSNAEQVDADVGVYDIEFAPFSVIAPDGRDVQGNYEGIAVTLNTVTVIPADPVTITGRAIAKQYGDTYEFTENDITVNGLVAGDTLAAWSAASDGAPAEAAVGTYPVSFSDALLLGTDGRNANSNYESIIYDDGDLTVNQRGGASVQAIDQTKTYGELFAFTGTEVTSIGLLDGHSVSLANLSSQGAPVTADAGSYPISVATPVIRDAAGSDVTDNYTGIPLFDGIMTVEQAAAVTITVNDREKIYGETAVFGLADIDAATLVAGDRVDSISVASNGAPADAFVGSYDIEPTGAMILGADNQPALSNYEGVIYVPGTLDIEQAEAIVITPDDVSKTYGQTTALSAFGAEGLAAGDTISGLTLSSLGEPARAPSGSYEIDAADAVILAPSGIDASVNYAGIVYNTGTLTVGQSALTITADDLSKTYGETFAPTGQEFNAAGLVSGDMVSLVSLASAGFAGNANVAPGGYSVAASDAVILGPNGEDVSESYATPDFVDGTLSILPAELTVTALDQTKPLGTPLSFTGTEFVTGGLLFEDSVERADISSPGAETDASLGGNPYPIEIDNASGRGLGNYTIAYRSGTMIVSGEAIADGDTPNDIGGNTDAPDLGNPADNVDLGDDVDLTETLIPAAASPADPESADNSQVQILLDTAGEEMTQTIAACRQTEPSTPDFIGCVSRALNSYTATLDAAEFDLPEPLQEISAAIVEARQKIDVARASAAVQLRGANTAAERAAIENATIQAARDAISEAGSRVRRVISLVTTDDPELTQVYFDQGNEVLQALQNVDNELQFAIGL